MTAAPDRRHKPENPLQRDTFAAENVAMSDLSTFHDKNQGRCGVAHVDEVHDEIEIQLKTPAKKVPEHRRWWRMVVIMGSDWHCRTANDQRKTRCRSLHGELFREHFRARVWTRHVVGRHQGIFRNGTFRGGRAEKNG